MSGIFKSSGVDLTNHPHPEMLEATAEDARPTFTSYTHMMSFLYALSIRPLFGLPAVNGEDAVSEQDGAARCDCGTSGQQHDAQHTVAEFAMKYHPFLLEGYEIYDLALPKNTRMKRWQF